MLIKNNIAGICTVGEGLAPPIPRATQPVSNTKHQGSSSPLAPRPSVLVSFTLYPVPCTLESQYTKPSPARQVSVVFPFRVVYNEI